MAPYEPVVAFTVASTTTTRAFVGLKTLTITDVLAPGAGDTCPETSTVAGPKYDETVVPTVNVYDDASAAPTSPRTATIASTKMATGFILSPVFPPLARVRTFEMPGSRGCQSRRMLRRPRRLILTAYWGQDSGTLHR